MEHTHDTHTGILSCNVHRRCMQRMRHTRQGTKHLVVIVVRYYY
jgi:hypothetical protein